MIRLKHLVNCCCQSPEDPYPDTVYWFQDNPTRDNRRLHVIVVLLGCMPVGEPNNFASWERYANGTCPPAWVGSGAPPGRPFLLRWDHDWTFVRANTDDGISVELDIGDPATGTGIWKLRTVEELRITEGAQVMVWRRTAGVGLLFVPGASTDNGRVSSLDFVSRVGPGIFRGAAPPANITVNLTGWGPGPAGGPAACADLNISRLVPLLYANVVEVDGWALCMGSGYLLGEAAYYEDGPVPPATGITVTLTFGGNWQRSNFDFAGGFATVTVCSLRPSSCLANVPTNAFVTVWYTDDHGGPGDAFGVSGSWLAERAGNLGSWCGGGSVQLVY